MLPHRVDDVDPTNVQPRTHPRADFLCLKSTLSVFALLVPVTSYMIMRSQRKVEPRSYDCTDRGAHAFMKSL